MKTIKCSFVIGFLVMLILYREFSFVSLLASNEGQTDFQNCSVVIDGNKEINFSISATNITPDYLELKNLILGIGEHSVIVKGGSPIRELGRDKVFVETGSYLFLVFYDQFSGIALKDTCTIILRKKDGGRLL
jgi:hypothetical protein